ncbi:MULTISPECIES: YoaK family protein [Staphylococcus]|uniref:YoaK family protein n=1 Tax=Staphylococcus TaxID=1279 RepID=UPI000CCFF331|nr:MULTISPECIES: YoaK family protein [Staphylococcus]MDI9230538.1 YoaK family protein [Staphylococcus caprae]POA04088.1 DUF1275 domain-containing protein [Staphylococcus caprae]HCG74214.1 DUF1275 domain-containing protein [Staphylococcus sp.]
MIILKKIEKRWVDISLDKYLTQNIYQFKEIAIALTFVGGYVDAYTFLERGGTLAAGQTGNIIFLASEVSHHNLDGGLLKIISVLSFMIGVMFVSLLHAKIATRYWRLIALLPITISSIVVGFTPSTVSNLFIIPPLAFSMAMLTTAFSKIEGEGYANTFSTGNLKKGVVALSEYMINKDKVQLSKSLLYIRIVISFVVGAIVSALLQKFMGIYTILIAAIILLGVLIFYSFLIYRRERNIQ